VYHGSDTHSDSQNGYVTTRFAIQYQHLYLLVNNTYSTEEREGTWVVVELDEPGTKYYIEKSLLTDHSEYFRKALRGPCRKSEESLVRLDDVSCITCKFVPWMQNYVEFSC
jgi:hypothetical protein